jgi:hypothetical protein
MRNIRFPRFEKADRARGLALDRQLKRLPDEQPRQSARPFALVISWLDTRELRLQVTQRMCHHKRKCKIGDYGQT